jgi:hypothetical protein
MHFILRRLDIEAEFARHSAPFAAKQKTHAVGTETDNEESADQDGDAGVEIEVEDENGEI